MCAYTPPIRLFVDSDLVKGATLSLDREQSHYLGHVMRRSAGDRLEIFNGRTDSFIAELTDISRKSASVQLVELCSDFKTSPDLWFLFAPVKRTRLDFMAQKATELGVRHIQPVNTDYCQVSRVNQDRLSANAVEAAEQTGGSMSRQSALFYLFTRFWRSGQLIGTLFSVMRSYLRIIT